MSRPRVAIIGAPSRAGAHYAGQEQAPAALHAVGFVSRLRSAGLDGVDMGDVVEATFTVDAPESKARKLSPSEGSGAGDEARTRDPYLGKSLRVEL